MGGWGLGGGHEENTRLGQEEEEDEPPSDWDQAQVCLIDMLKIWKFLSNSTGGRRKDGWFKYASRLTIQIDVIYNAFQYNSDGRYIICSCTHHIRVSNPSAPDQVPPDDSAIHWLSPQAPSH